MAEKPKTKTLPQVVTPPGVLSFAHLKEPDTKGKYADNKYKTDVVFDDDEKAKIFKEAVAEKVAELVKVEWPKLKNASMVKLPFKDGNERTNKDGEILEGYEDKVYVTPKSKYKPKVVDAKKNPVPDTVWPSGGDLARAICELYPCTVSGKPTIALRLKAIQIIEKRAGGGGRYEDLFEEEDGFEAEGEDAASSDGESDFA